MKTPEEFEKWYDDFINERIKTTPCLLQGKNATNEYMAWCACEKLYLKKVYELMYMLDEAHNFNQ